MILNGKAKEDFLKQFCGLLPINEIEQNAHIIEWFDSVGIYVQIFYSEEFYSEIKDYLSPREFGKYKKHFTDGLKNRTEATTEAIKKANEIYNQQ